MNKPNSTFNTFEEEHSEAQSTAACYPSYTSFESNSPQFSNSPYQDTDSLSDKSKKIRKKRNTYQKIDDDTRILLLDAVKQGDTLKAAAKRYNINYSSAKSILHTYRKEGRILKKSAQERTARKRTKSSQNLEMSPIYLYKQEDFPRAGESPNYQAFYSTEPKFQIEHQPHYEIPNEEDNRGGMNPMGINTFGGYLKINQQTQQYEENLPMRNPASTLVLKLESQPMYGQSHNDNKSSVNRNWQLNVNVHSDGLDKQRTFAYPQGGLVENKLMSNAPEKFKVFDPIYMNSSMYSSSPLFHQGFPQREDPVYNPPVVQNTYNHYDIVNNGTEMMNLPAQEQGYDVSCFLNSSPNYSFPQKMTDFNGTENSYPSNIKSLILEPQETLYDGSTKGTYPYYKSGTGLTNSLKSY